MPKRKTTYKRKSRLSAYAVLMSILVMLAFLAWRGIVVAEGKDIPPTLTWRVVDDADLF